MHPIIFDTTVWIDYLNGAITEETDFLHSYLNKNYKLYLCPIILQEVLQGIRDDKTYNRVKDFLLHIDMLTITPLDASIGAAESYRVLRKKGLTIRKSNECTITFYALYFDLPLIHNDRDFDAIAKYTPLKIGI